MGGSGPYAIAQVAGARGRLARFQDGLVSRGVAGAGHTRLYFLFEGPFTDESIAKADAFLTALGEPYAGPTSSSARCWSPAPGRRSSSVASTCPS